MCARNPEPRKGAPVLRAPCAAQEAGGQDEIGHVALCGRWYHNYIYLIFDILEEGRFK